MKVLRRYALMLLLILSVAVFAPFRTYAADGEIQFSDPTGKVGENVEVTFVVKSSESLGEVSGTVSYDSQALEFVSGSMFTEQSAGVLAFSGNGNGTDTELRTSITFRALKQTTTSLTVGSANASSVSGDTVNLVNGSASISIEPGEGGVTDVKPSKEQNAQAQTVAPAADDLAVTVDGKQYSFSDHFTADMLPEGFKEGKVTYNGTQKRVGVNVANVYVAYLIENTTGGKGTFYIYEADKSAFIPFVELKISEGTSIVPLNEPSAVQLPAEYEVTDLSVGAHTYPVWTNPQESGNYYIMYALNVRTGQKGLYRYDGDDATYQSFELPQKTEPQKTETTNGGHVLGVVQKHLKVFLVLVGAILVLFVLFLLILGIKLRNRNKELDELYDEYDFSDDEEDDEETHLHGRHEDDGSGVNVYDEDAYDEYDDDEYDEYDDEYEDEYEDEYDDEYEDEYDDEYDSEYEDGSGEGIVSADDFDDELEEDSFFDEDEDEYDDFDDDDFDVMDLFDDADDRGSKQKKNNEKKQRRK